MQFKEIKVLLAKFFFLANQISIVRDIYFKYNKNHIS